LCSTSHQLLWLHPDHPGYNRARNTTTEARSVTMTMNCVPLPAPNNPRRTLLSYFEQSARDQWDSVLPFHISGLPPRTCPADSVPLPSWWSSGWVTSKHSMNALCMAQRSASECAHSWHCSLVMFVATSWDVSFTPAQPVGVFGLEHKPLHSVQDTLHAHLKELCQSLELPKLYGIPMPWSADCNQLWLELT